jgi:hypothetical protein
MAKARPCKKETKKELAKNKTVATLWAALRLASPSLIWEIRSSSLDFTFSKNSSVVFQNQIPCCVPICHFNSEYVVFP